MDNLITDQPGTQTNANAGDMQIVIEYSCFVIDHFRHIKIQPKTIDLRTRLWRINRTNSVFIPQNLVLRSIVWGWMLIYRKWSIPFSLNQKAIHWLNVLTSGHIEDRIEHTFLFKIREKFKHPALWRYYLSRNKWAFKASFCKVYIIYLSNRSN